jgi:hypothetical protein
MKKPIKLNKKTIKQLKLQLQPKNDRKAAPVLYEGPELVASNGQCESSRPWYSC